MYLSQAFLSLGKPGSCKYVSAVSAQLLIRLMGKRWYSKPNGKRGSGPGRRVRADDNQFTLTYKELLSYGKRKNKRGEWVKGLYTQPQVTRAFDELLAKGFISIAEYGGAFEKHKQKYSLENDWANWQWGDPPVRIRRKDRKRGFQDKKNKTLHT